MYQVIIFLNCGILTSSCASQTTTVKGICNSVNGLDYCCNNYEAIRGICTECKTGKTTYTRGRCVSCKNDTYGYKCIMKCACNQLNRCDAEVGCVPMISIPTMSTTYAETTEPVLCSNDTVTKTEPTVTRNGTFKEIKSSMVVWIVLTISSIICCMLTGACCFICIYRKKQVLKLKIRNEGVILEPTPYIGVYNEVDENPLTFAITDFNVTAHEPHYETIDSSSQDKISLITSSYTEHSDTENGDLHVAIEEGQHQQLNDQTECISTNSSNSDVLNPDNTTYHNIFEPLQDNWKDSSHRYELPVIVHK